MNNFGIAGELMATVCALTALPHGPVVSRTDDVSVMFWGSAREASSVRFFEQLQKQK
jgi:hypothetical protein